jgi:hypothetical protein
MAFTLFAFDYLSAGGQLIALLPAGCIKAQRDTRAWRLLETVAEIEVISQNGNRAFAKCSPTTSIVKITKRSVELRENDGDQGGITEVGAAGSLELFRGSRPMFNVQEARKGRRISLVHSTELQNGGVELGKRHVAAHMSDVTGPAVLVPRVGLPKHDKIAVLEKSAAVALSDCVFALRCESASMAVDLQMSIRSRWETFRRLYSGTGAPYLTVRSLVVWLLERDYKVVLPVNAPRQLSREVDVATREYLKRYEKVQDRSSVRRSSERDPLSHSGQRSLVQ